MSDIVVDDNPMLILDYPAMLIVKEPQEWWTKDDSELFKASRERGGKS